MENKMTTTTTM